MFVVKQSMKKLVYLFILLFYPLVNLSQIQIGQDLFGNQADENFGHDVTLTSDGLTMVVGNRYTEFNNQQVGSVKIFKLVTDQWVQQGNTLYGSVDGMSFGFSVAISDDGNTVAVGTLKNDPFVTDAERVLVFGYANNSWQQKGQTLLSTQNGDSFGIDIALSGDGNRLAVGAPGFGNAGGRVSVFDYANSAWNQYGDSITSDRDNSFLGRSVALSVNGTVLGVGIPNDDSVFQNGGIVQVYQADNANWVQIGSDLAGSTLGELFGWDIALSHSGTELAVGAPFNGDNTLRNGKVDVFRNVNNSWTNIGPSIKGTQTEQRLGTRVSISSNGNVVASVSNAVNSSSGGFVSIFQNVNDAFLSVGNTIPTNSEGASVSLSNSGSTVAIGSYLFNDNGMSSIGRVQVFDVAQILSVTEYLKTEVVIFPNPTSSLITIKTPSKNSYTSAALYNALGREVLVSNSKTIDVSYLPTGVYFLNIEINTVNVIKKVVIQ